MKILQVNSKTYGSLEVLVDDEDFDKVSSYNWSVSKDRYKFYFHKRVSKKEKITLHRLVMGFPQGKYVDHINGNSLDNRKENLRACTNAANIRNGKIRTNNTSGYKGIIWDKERSKWLAQIKVNYKKIYLGRFADLMDAVLARKEAERKYYSI